MAIICLLVKITSKGPSIHWSKRVGLNNRLFWMPKFRTMYINTPNIATHLLEKPDLHVTRLGRILRKYSLDELPQVFNVFTGSMSIVGPRPALYNQYDLINLRTKKGIHKLLPGITGWAQINGRDEISIPLKVKLEEEYLNLRSFNFDIRIISRTIFHVISPKNIQH